MRDGSAVERTAIAEQLMQTCGTVLGVTSTSSDKLREMTLHEWNTGARDIATIGEYKALRKKLVSLLGGEPACAMFAKRSEIPDTVNELEFSASQISNQPRLAMEALQNAGLGRLLSVHRPMASPVSVTVLEPVFNDFAKDVCESPDCAEAPALCTAVANVIQVFAVRYATETGDEGRYCAVWKSFEACVGARLPKCKVMNDEPDGVCEGVLAELKNEHDAAFTQLTVYYARQVASADPAAFASSRMSCFLVALEGPSLTVYGASVSDKIVVDELASVELMPTVGNENHAKVRCECAVRVFGVRPHVPAGHARVHCAACRD